MGAEGKRKRQESSEEEAAQQNAVFSRESRESRYPSRKRVRQSSPVNQPRSNQDAEQACPTRAAKGHSPTTFVFVAEEPSEEERVKAQKEVDRIAEAERCQMHQLDSDDYFEVLGVSRSATDADVKKAYRKLAVQWHPDKNRSNARAEEYFKRIGEAYEVLSNPDKRKLYERYGKQGLEHGGGTSSRYSDSFGGGVHTGFSARHARDIFEAFFGGMDPFEEFMGDPYGRRSSSGRPQRHDPMDMGMGMSMGMNMGFGMRGGGGISRMMDSFFSDGFGGGGFGDFGPGVGGGFSQSVSTSSYMDRSGHTVTKKTTTTVNGDGQTETLTEEFRNGQLVNSSSTTTTRLADAGRMQLEGGAFPDGYNSHRKMYQREGSSSRSGGRF